MDPNYSYQTPQRYPNDTNGFRGPEVNNNRQPPTGLFNSQGPPMNRQQPSLGFNVNTQGQGPSFNQAPDNIEVSERTPFSSE